MGLLWKKLHHRDTELAESFFKNFFCSASYASIGLEVHLEPAQAKDLACSECQPPQPSATVEGWYVIYTRPKNSADSAPDETDELW